LTPYNLTVSPDGKRLYAAANDQVVVSNTTTNTVVTRISGFPGESGKAGSPSGIAITEDGTKRRYRRFRGGVGGPGGLLSWR